MERKSLEKLDGGWVLDPKPCVHGGLPEKLATAFAKLLGGRYGATFTPLVYCGHQLVHGTNYMIICKATYTTASLDTAIEKVILHETFPSGGSLFGEFSVLSIEKIAEEMPEGGYKLDPFPYIPGDLSHDPIHDAFEQARAGFMGSRIEPLAFCGTQHLGPAGINHMFICKTTLIVPDEVVHVDVVTLNEKDKVFKLVGDITEIV